MTPEKLLERLRRVEQQIRAFRELHASEFQIILDELSDITSELATAKEPSPDETAPASTAEGGAAASPKRAKWLAEQERKSQPMSRRELLRGRDDGGGAKP